jgi:fido (protein-threonine AMPylation protein)
VILFDLTDSEYHPAYQALAISNGARQYDFLRSIVIAALETNKTFLTQGIISALNYHAIACLHTNAGEDRPCQVTVGNYTPPPHFRVSALMDDFIADVNRSWEGADPVALAAYVLWRLNYIHPFINGNGRTARVTSYYVLCLKSGGLLKGAPILPELITQNRDDYVLALQTVDTSLAAGSLDLGPLHKLISHLLEIQLSSEEQPI